MNNKKIVSIIFVLLTINIIASSCGKNIKYNTIEWSSNALMESMKDFDKAKCISQVNGERFTAKLFECMKVPIQDDSVFYYYTLAVAPTTEMPLNDLQIAFEPGKVAADYYHNYEHLLLGGPVYHNGLDASDWNASLAPMNEAKDFVAIGFTLMWSNGTNRALAKANISQAAFDAAMEEMTIHISCKGYSGESIELHMSPDLVTSADDPRLTQDHPVLLLLKQHIITDDRGSF